MNNEYIVINKTELLKEIEELKEQQKEFLSNHPDDISIYDSLQREVDCLEQQILSKSTPLIPEIEKAFDAGYDLNTWEQLEIPNEERDYLNEQDYISNLKLDI